MPKIAYNTCYGGFSLSAKACARYEDITGISVISNSGRDLKRNDPALIRVIEELGAEANGNFADIALAELPTGTKYRINEYDGTESVMTPNDYEWETA